MRYRSGIQAMPGGSFSFGRSSSCVAPRPGHTCRTVHATWRLSPAGPVMDEMITLHNSCTDLRDADVGGANLRRTRLNGAKLCEDQCAVVAGAGADLDGANSENTRSRA